VVVQLGGWAWGEQLLTVKNKLVTKIFKKPWNVRSMYRAGSLRAVAEEISKYKLDLVGVQEVRWGGSGTEAAGKYTFFYGKGIENCELGTGFFVHKRIMACSMNGGEAECI
jgi:hypothetical protein